MARITSSVRESRVLFPIEADGPGRVKIVPTGEKCAGCGRPFTNVSQYRSLYDDPEGRKWCILCGGP